jgi:hypothetical protein
MSMKEPAMQLFQGLPALTRALPDLPDAAWIALPESLAQALRQASVAEDDPAGVDGDAELAGITQAFAAAGARLLVQAGDAPTRMGYQPWLPVAALRSEHPWPAGDDLQGADWQLRLRAEFGHASRFRALFQQDWGDDDVPAPEWPPASALDERVAAWAQAARAWAWFDERTGLTPASQAEIRATEWRLGCPLPPALAAWHRELGCEDFGERLLPAKPDGDMDGDNAIVPLLRAYPGIPDIAEYLPDAEARDMLALVDRLVAFGDYLGNGNQWCFHRDTGAVWYFDHDTAPHLAPMFDDVADYLDALAIKALCEAHAAAQGEADGDEQAERLIAERWGEDLIGKWMY